METTNRIMLTTIGAALGLFLATSSGLLASSHEKSAASNLKSSEWLAVHIDGSNAAHDANSTIRFREAGKIGGNSGCHGYTANISLDGNKISFSEITETKNLCSPREEKATLSFLTSFEKTTTFSINSDVLRFTDDGGNELIEFRRLGMEF